MDDSSLQPPDPAIRNEVRPPAGMAGPGDPAIPTHRQPPADDPIRQAQIAAQDAGELSDPLPILSAAEIDAPLELLSVDALDDRTEAVPFRVDGYRILREISRGGQAAVFEAIQESTGRTVALKILHGGVWVSSEARTRFDREIRLLAALHHPNIVSILGRGRTHDGAFYLAMEYIDGPTLDAYYAGPRTWTTVDVVRIFLKIGAAVAEAHRQGMIHRDLKPSNIRVDHRGEPHLLDFGLARALAPEDLAPASWQTITQPNRILGSIPWGSPEQVSGGTKPVDHRSDVYSLGFMLYVILKGSPPIPVVGDITQVIRHIVHSTPQPLHSDLPGLDAVVMRAMAKAADDRYQSVHDLIDDLETVLAGQPIRRSTWRIRRRTAWVIVLAVAVAASGYGLLGRGDRPLWWASSSTASTNSLGMTMQRVPPGTFTVAMGDESSDNAPPIQITLTREVWISAKPVTRRDFDLVMLGKSVPADQQPDPPVTGVTWAQAHEFCARLSKREQETYRLPTEAEWERAWGLDLIQPGAASPQVEPVKGSTATLGIPSTSRGDEVTWADWCLDFWQPRPLGPQTDPQGARSGTSHLVRGLRLNPHTQQWVPTSRSAWSLQASLPNTGFRVVRETMAR